MTTEPTERRASTSKMGMRMIDHLAAHRAGYTDHDHARVRLADSTRRLVRELADTNASIETLLAADALVEQVVALLAAEPHGRTYFGSAEGALIGSSDLTFVDFSPFVGPMSPVAPPIVVTVLPDRVRGDVVYPLVYEGPPGHVHGGFIAAGFDEVLGFAQGYSGKAGMTGRLEIRYRSPTPLHQPLVYEAGIESVVGRKVTCWGTLMHGDTLCAEATGLFIAFDPEKMVRLMAVRGDGPSGLGERGEQSGAEPVGGEGSHAG